MRRALVWLTGTLAAAAVVAGGFLVGGGHVLLSAERPAAPATAAPPAQRPVPVTGGTAEVRDFPIYRMGIGTVQAFNTVTVKVRVDGEVQKIAFREGQDVKQGDLLAVIDP